MSNLPILFVAGLPVAQSRAVAAGRGKVAAAADLVIDAEYVVEKSLDLVNTRVKTCAASPPGLLRAELELRDRAYSRADSLTTSSPCHLIDLHI